MKRHDYPYDFSEKYSCRDFTGCWLAGRDDMNGIAIFGSCFSQEIPDSPSLPSRLTGATFVRCNLDNVTIPAGNTVIECSQKRFKAQNDGNDWIVDENGYPVKPVDYAYFEKRGLPIPAPEDIPTEKVSIAIDLRSLGAK